MFACTLTGDPGRNVASMGVWAGNEVFVPSMVVRGLSATLNR
jgi:hypothetical protein